VALEPAFAAFLRQSLEQLFSRNPFANYPLDLSQIYRHRVALRATRNQGQIEKLSAAIEDTYGKQLDLLLGEHSWLNDAIARAFGASRGQSAPVIVHLILLHHLGIPLKDALFYAQTSMWVCPNGLCKHYGAHTLVTLRRLESSYELQCRYCGIVFRINRETPIASPPGLSRLIRPGPVLTRKVARFLRAGISQGRIQKRAKIGRNTFYAVLLELGSPSVPIKLFANRINSAAERHKAAVLKWLHDHPCATRTELWHSHVAERVKRLRTIDPAWCELNLPKLSSPKRKPSAVTKTTDKTIHTSPRHKGSSG